MRLWLYSIGNTLKVYILERHTDTPTITDMEGLLYRYLVRRTSGAEDREVYAWLEASEKNRSLFFEVAAVWSAHRTLISPATGERCDAMLRRLNARIDADDAMQRPARFAWRRWMSAAAAAAVVVIAVAAAWLAGLRLPEAGRFQSYANHTGDVAVLHLEDGTQVWLQDGTELRYAVGKGDGERIVRLDGEAYFDVSHDARHPFVVETRELAIRVLGTAFNVRALAGNPFTEVVLERGAVRLETPGGDNLVRLHPNQRAVYDARMGDMEVAEINAPLYVTRRYNLVTMKGATITEIIAGIEKSYGVRIRIMSPDDGKRYDINYLRSNSLEEVVDIVEFMTGTHCEVIRNE